MSDGFGILLPGQADFAAWRRQARRLLAAEVPPERVEWRVAGDQPGLFGAAPPPADAAPPTASVPRAFLEQQVSAHSLSASSCPSSHLEDVQASN
jgi:DNA polymerase